jgi:predicted component of type VI protein secretion system
MKGLNTLEQAVLDRLLAGDLPVLATLRAQAEKARLVNREFSGIGFFCSFEVPPEAPTLEGSSNFELDDVNGTLKGLAHGAGFVLFIRNGRLDMLEGFSYDEPWPQDVGQFTLTYQSEPRKLPL